LFLLRSFLTSLYVPYFKRNSTVGVNQPLLKFQKNSFLKHPIHFLFRGFDEYLSESGATCFRLPMLNYLIKADILFKLLLTYIWYIEISRKHLSTRLCLSTGSLQYRSLCKSLCD